jgi:hypothetical protein
VTLPEGLTPGVWTLDMSQSEIGFTVRHAGISSVRGRFKEATAEARVGESLADSSLHASVKTASFDSGDPTAMPMSAAPTSSTWRGIRDDLPGDLDQGRGRGFRAR